MSRASDFRPLEDELARWRADGARLQCWLRDDDAVAPTPALDRLLEFGEAYSAPIALAVIPSDASEALAQRIAPAEHVAALPHGWAHRNHAPPDAKKTEFGADRPLADRFADAERGWRRCQALFGAQAAPVFTPPWNRAAPDLFAALPLLGLRAISQYGPRGGGGAAAAGLTQLNTHLDPIDWRGGGGLVDPSKLIADAATALADRREGRSDNAEPYGVLTHHLVHDAAIWRFLEALFEQFAAFADCVEVIDIRSLEIFTAR